MCIVLYAVDIFPLASNENDLHTMLNLIHVAQSASRALGLIITKCKSLGGVPYNMFTKLLLFSCETGWFVKSYSCIDTVQNRAMKFLSWCMKIYPKFV